MGEKHFVKPFSFEFIVAGVLALLTLGLDQADVHVMLITWLSILACPCLILDGLRRTEWAKRVGKKSGKFIAACSAVILCFGIIGIWVHWRHDYKQPEADPYPSVAPIQVETPILTAKLIFDSITKAEAQCHLEVENIGSLPASALRVYSRSEGAWSADIIASPSTDIIPHDKLSFHCPPFYGVAALKRPLGIYFMVVFNDNSGAHIATYHTIFHFMTMADAQPLEPISPNAIQRESGDVPPDMVARPLYTAFDSASGTFLLQFPERLANGAPNRVWMRNRLRQLLVDGGSGKVTFQANFPKGQRLLEESLGAGTAGTHVVVVEWDDQKQTIGISVDGSKLAKTKPQ